MSKAIIIGAGGVSNVIAHKCAQFRDTFSALCIASRTEAKCKVIAERIGARIPAQTRTVDADSTSEVTALIREFNADIVINAALPLQNLPIMEACIESGVHYIDTSAPEPDPDKYEMFAYKWQTDLHSRFQEKGIMALLSLGFDPGVTNVYCAWAAKHLFDELHVVDILDCNGGNHGHPFATNFNPVTNIQEVTQPAVYWKEDEWISAGAFSIKKRFDFQQIGVRDLYLIYHEEIESLVQFLPHIREMRFWMHFSEQYLRHLEVLQNVGLTSIDPVNYEGMQIRPLEFLQCVLPDPASLGDNYTGKTNIGCLFQGIKGGAPRRCYLYNNCDHAEAFEEVSSQAVSYTTGVPAVLGAKLLLEGTWMQPGAVFPEQLDPDPFMDEVGAAGLPWKLEESDALELIS